MIKILKDVILWIKVFCERKMPGDPYDKDPER
jgi:hypothetical protein